MTIAEAEMILMPPIVFGDEKQISARKFLEDVATLVDMIETGKVTKYEGEWHIPVQFWGDVEREALKELGEWTL